MSVTAADFRTHFPEFTDATLYPNGLVSYWLSVAEKLVNADRWGTLTDTGIELLAAHNIVLERKAAAASETGAVPGEASGGVASKSIDSVSVSYDTSSSAEEGAGNYNLTTYGQRYWHLAKLMGAGGMFIGGSPDTSQSAASGAWPGPYYPFGW